MQKRLMPIETIMGCNNTRIREIYVDCNEKGLSKFLLK